MAKRNYYERFCFLVLKNTLELPSAVEDLGKNKDLLKLYLEAPASSKYHCSFEGGLAMHTYSTMDIAFRMFHSFVEEVKLNMNDVITAILWHDIGKIGIPEGILNKPASLDKKEWESIKKHPLIGVEILSPIKDLEEVRKAIKCHHEHFNGKGYPEGLKGKKIPLISAIIAVADAYDAMTSDRPYRKALSPQKAKEEIKKNKGTQFHPQVVDAFLKVFSNGK